jgi:SAM-dependent methyltransferase
MNLEDLHFLLSPSGERLLLELGETPITAQNHLLIASRLRQRIEPAQAVAVLDTLWLRQLATAKFSRAAQMFFTRPALEQASSESVATYRAQRFRASGLDNIADLGCGIGGDALALAAVADVIGVDWDPVRVTMALENVRVYGFAERFHPLQADLRELTPLPVQACFFDPSRRDEHGRRFFSVEQYQPPLSMIERWLEKIPHVAVKIGPAVDYAELPEHAEIEFISVGREVKEGILWFGDLHSGEQRRATLLPAGHTLSSGREGEEKVPVVPPGSFLYEPHRAVIRAHLVEILASLLGASKIDQDIAYLTSETVQATPFARCFVIEAVFPFQLKRLRHYLRQHQIGHVTIKKRGSPLEPDMLRRQLRLSGDEERVVFLTQVMGEATVLIGQAIDEPEQGVSI